MRRLLFFPLALAAVIAVTATISLNLHKAYIIDYIDLSNGTRVKLPLINANVTEWMEVKLYFKEGTAYVISGTFWWFATLPCFYNGLIFDNINETHAWMQAVNETTYAFLWRGNITVVPARPRPYDVTALPSCQAMPVQ